MKYHQIDSALFIENRKRFVKHLKPKSLAIFFSNDIMPTNADGTMPFRQNADLFYLSGADQEESILAIFPEASNPDHREILFLRETNAQIAIWEGEKLTVEKAREVSGIQNIQWLDKFDIVLKTLMAEAEHVYLNSNEHLRATIEVETREVRMGKEIREKYPLHRYERSAPIMHSLRAIKQPIEIELMKRAAAIDVQGYKRVMKFIKPGVWEYEIEAEFAHEFLRNRSRGFGYTPIIASGYNACVLHYIENNQQCKDGDLILIDVGSEYANYHSDITRTLPVNGRFSPRQKQVYNAVLHVMKEAMKLLRPGNQLHEYHKEVGKIMEGQLLALGLIDKTDIKNQNPAWPAYKKYFMHGTSHYLGLDVHDVGHWNVKMEAGNAFTCEPGIYIPEENMGIRIEDDVIITENGLINLTEGAPKEVEAIEEMMNSH
jgi:Xaa-Pro aminopeptidase